MSARESILRDDLHKDGEDSHGGLDLRIRRCEDLVHPKSKMICDYHRLLAILWNRHPFHRDLVTECDLEELIEGLKFAGEILRREVGVTVLQRR